eukprot:333158-Chlamydomonas_euryale.AAC.5
MRYTRGSCSANASSTDTGPPSTASMLASSRENPTLSYWSNASIDASAKRSRHETRVASYHAATAAASTIGGWRCTARWRPVSCCIRSAYSTSVGVVPSSARYAGTSTCREGGGKGAA